MTNKQMNELFLEELEFKRQYTAKYDFDCELCSSVIEEGDDFVFLGDKQRICLDCVEEMRGKLSKQLEVGE